MKWIFTFIVSFSWMSVISSGEYSDPYGVSVVYLFLSLLARSARLNAIEESFFVLMIVRVEF